MECIIYLKRLINSDLVVIAGQRVEIGKRVTETLYARSALVFYHADDIIGPDGLILDEIKVKMLSVMLQEYFQENPPSVELIQKIIIDLMTNKHQLLVKIEDYLRDDRIKELYKDLDWQKTIWVFDYFTLLVWIISHSSLLDLKRLQ